MIHHKVSMVHWCSLWIPFSLRFQWCHDKSRQVSRLLQTRRQQSHDAEDDRSERGSKQPQKQAQPGASGRCWFVAAKILVQVIVWLAVSHTVDRHFFRIERISAQNRIGLVLDLFVWPYSFKDCPPVRGAEFTIWDDGRICMSVFLRKGEPWYQ